MMQTTTQGRFNATGGTRETESLGRNPVNGTQHINMSMFLNESDCQNLMRNPSELYSVWLDVRNGTIADAVCMTEKFLALENPSLTDTVKTIMYGGCSPITLFTHLWDAEYPNLIKYFYIVEEYIDQLEDSDLKCDDASITRDQLKKWCRTAIFEDNPFHDFQETASDEGWETDDFEPDVEFVESDYSQELYSLIRHWKGMYKDKFGYEQRKHGLEVNSRTLPLYSICCRGEHLLLMALHYTGTCGTEDILPENVEHRIDILHCLLQHHGLVWDKEPRIHHEIMKQHCHK